MNHAGHHSIVPCAPWKFGASTLWAVAALLAWFVAQCVVTFVVFQTSDLSVSASASEVTAFASRAQFVSPIMIISAAAAIGVILWAVFKAHCSFSEYLALAAPRKADLIVGLVCIAVLLPLGDFASYLTGRDIVPPFVVNLYKSARESNTIVLLVLAMVVAAPLMEELLFRGFLFRGYAASRLGVLGAIILPAAIWAPMHIQYELFYVVQIFIFGIVLGWLRWRSGSTLLVMILHAAVNFSSLAETAFIVERAS